MEGIGQDTTAAQHPEAAEAPAPARVLRGRRRRTRNRGQPEGPERAEARGSVHVPGSGRTACREYRLRQCYLRLYELIIFRSIGRKKNNKK